MYFVDELSGVCFVDEVAMFATEPVFYIKLAANALNLQMSQMAKTEFRQSDKTKVGIEPMRTANQVRWTIRLVVSLHLRRRLRLSSIWKRLPEKIIVYRFGK